MSGTLRTARRDNGVVILTIDNPRHKNSLNDGIISGLIEALDAAATDQAVRVVVLRGADGLFCAGRELNDLIALQQADTETITATYRTLGRLNEALYYCPRPTIALIERYALGAGAALSSWADIAIAEAGSLIGYPEVKIGLPPSQTTVSLIRSIGRKAAMDLLLTARNITAEEALQMGLVSRVVPKGGAESALEETLQALLANSPEAITRTKQMVWKAEDVDYRTASAIASDAISVAITTREARKGIAAFVEKRRPIW